MSEGESDSDVDPRIGMSGGLDEFELPPSFLEAAGLWDDDGFGTMSIRT